MFNMIFRIQHLNESNLMIESFEKNNHNFLASDTTCLSVEKTMTKRWHFLDRSDRSFPTRESPE